MPRVSLSKIREGLFGAEKRRAPAHLVVLTCLLLGWGALLGYYPLAWDYLRAPFPGFTLEPNGVLSPWGRPTWARFQVTPPLAEPEKLIAVDGVPVNTSAEFVQRLREHYQPNGQAFFTFVQPDGAQRVLLLPLGHLPAADVVDMFALLYLVGLAGLALGTWVFISQTERMGRVFALALLTLSLNLALASDLVTVGNFARLWLTTMSLSGAFLAHLALLFPYPVSWLDRHSRWQYLPYILALVLLIAGQATLYHWPSSWAFIWTWRAIYLGVGAGMLFFLGMQGHRLWRPPSATARQQSRIVLMGATLALTPVIFWLFSNILGYPRPFGGIYAVFALCLPVALTYAVLRYRLAYMDTLLARGVTYGALTLLGVGAYYLLAHFLAARGSLLAEHDAVFIALFVMVVLALAGPARMWMQRRVDRLFLRGLVEYHATLLHFRHHLAELRAPEAVSAALETQIAALRPCWTALWLRDPGADAYRQASGPATDVPPAWVQHVTAHAGAFLLDPARRAADAALSLPDAALCAPLWCGETLLGWLLLGRRKDDLPYTPAELEFVAALAEAAAPALDHAYRFEQMAAEIEALRGQIAEGKETPQNISEVSN